MIKQTFTIFRATKDFMDTLNSNKVTLDLHRRRSFDFDDKNDEMVKANQGMLDQGYLIPVATVECSLNDLFTLTNNITHSWLDNEEVTLLDDNGFISSTSIGDVFTDQSGQALLVTMTNIVPVDLTINTTEKEEQHEKV